MFVTVRNKDVCRCSDPRGAHEAFVWGVPPNGSVHIPQVIIARRKEHG